MSRSYRHTPIGGITCCRSEKWWKQKWHRVFRRTAKTLINQDREPPLYPEDVGGNLWSGPKDGKSWFGYMRNHVDHMYYYRPRKECQTWPYLYRRMMRK